MNDITLSQHTKEIRKNILQMIFKAGGSHIGCSLGIVEILVALYYRVLNIDPQKPMDDNRDRFILSKGHACAAFYATLAQRGFFQKKELDTLYADGSKMAAHVTYGSFPGIEATAGSLGHGLSMGIGMAIAAKEKKSNTKVYVLVGDGECQEGSIWEAIIFAGHHKLDNLIMIIDNNNFQSEDRLEKILNLNPFDKKLTPFGWETIEVDGHDIEEIVKALNKRHPQKPLAVIARTTKGKGVSFMENDYIWHGKCPTEEQYNIALEELTS